jgi:hypothetical protein
VTPDLQRALSRYADSGWVDANRDAAERSTTRRGFVVPAYLVLASDILVHPRSEVQVTTRCYQSFRANKMVVTEGTARFDLVDLKVGFRSQFTRAQSLPLREHVALSGVRPDLIRWPLDTCACGSEVSARAIIPDGCEEDHGAVFEVVLLGETVL